MKALFPILGYAAAVILAVLLFRQCENSNRLSENAEVSKEVVSTLKLKNGQLAAEKRAYLATEEEMRAQLWIKDDSLKVLLDLFKNPKVAYRIKTVIQIDSIPIPFEVPVEHPFSRPFNKTTNFYTITGTVNQSGLTLDRISIPNTQRIVTGVKKGWFKNDITTTLTNSNPFITTEEIDTQTLSVRNKRLGVGVFAGLDFRGEVTAGVGLNYNLIEF